MALTAIAGLAAAAATTYGAAQASANASAANKRQGAIAAGSIQQQQNDAQYTKALNALALQRSTAGSIDSRGSRAGYDPATNTWRTTLSPEAAAIQHQGDEFSKQNLRDTSTNNAQTVTTNARNASQTGEANNSAMLSAIQARSSADTARRKLDAFRPQSTNEIEGGMQQVATTANRQAQQPIIADTLRSFARTGTAAAPVLTSMMRDNATNLRQSMLQDHIAAMTNGEQINNAKRQGLQSTFSTLDSAATPRLQFAGQGGVSGAQTQDVSSALSNEIAQRAASAGTTGIQAGSVANQGAAAGLNARKLAADYVPYNNSGDQVSAMSSNIKELLKNGRAAYGSLFGGGAGNAGDSLRTGDLY